jgi:hypothetical protein
MYVYYMYTNALCMYIICTNAFMYVYYMYVCIYTYIKHLYIQMPLCMCVYIQMPRGLLDEGAELLLIDLRGNVGGYFPAGV